MQMKWARGGTSEAILQVELPDNTEMFDKKEEWRC